ncbi:Re/Si-specific NAD(P)(+) transhydrogenase subunit alpha [Nannocystis pusilla]|uniref:proton-translocating NAD(P)(+) transhydrogenase n=1 Tax=Nannocystis pusilla TaxID=889268 RepID=A0ABS7TTF7_9BACT|nr:Re/Si-specific NAD(P)(+) transhydrogenase subunit alpha [Nannocystis pusilla]MBZ5711499.1 Re/Si-specific NAD(P)(+) transhydrogenase subunit alpha [Nannocystis pusilla]
MKIGIPKEIYPGERRVAATPDTAKRLQSQGFAVVVESGAGAAAEFGDDAYASVGCGIAADAAGLWEQVDIVLKVRPPTAFEVDLLRDGQVLIGFVWPAQNPDLVERLRSRGATVLGMDAVPRISRAQKLDALSSMGNISGYRAVIEAANCFGRFFTGQITAAGKVPPAKVLVIGAGVAGLAVIGVARGLGAIVRAFDTRPVVKEQVESMGAEFLELDFKEDGTGIGGYAKEMSPAFIAAEMDLFRRQAEEVDIIVTTALIPGKPAPKLILRDMVERMKPGSVIVDLAAETGGNCELTAPGEKVVHGGVTIIGYTDLPSRMAAQSSQLYGTNLCHLLDDMGKATGFRIDENDEVVRGCLITHAGEIKWPPPRPAAPAAPAPAPAAAKPTPAAAAPEPPRPSAPPPKSHGHGHGPPAGESSPWPLLLAGVALVGIGLGVDDQSSFLSHFTVFVLACFIGYQVVWSVSPALHTPLMSVTNAISGIIIIGGMLQISGAPTSAATLLGAAAILLAMINVAGGFLVTQRMLKMFRK